MPDYVHQRISEMLNARERSINGTSVLLLGLAYKAGTSDWRESPSVKVAHRLASSGAKVSICDPHIDRSHAGEFADALIDFSADSLAAQDLVVVLVDHPEFMPEIVALESRLVFDAKNLLANFDFEGEVL